MIKDELADSLQRLRDVRAIYAAELEDLPEGKLQCMHNGEIVRFYQATREDGKYVRKGITRNKQLVRELARKGFLEKAMPTIDANVKVLEKALRSYKPCNPENIADELTETFSNVPKDSLFSPTVDVMLMTLDMEDIKRIASHAKWGSEPYTPTDYKSEGRNIVTSRGEKMRSKAEAMIAEKLYEYGIAFRYEQPLELADGIFHPDFTFEGAGGEMFYLEFCGMMDSESYVNAFKRKRASYEAAGIEEWRNMIYVFSSGNNMNMQEIDRVIQTRVIPLL